MKKFLFITVLSLFALNANAQIRYGARAGLNMTNVLKHHYGSKTRYGFQVGGYALVPINKDTDQFFFQPELVYSQQGERNEASGYKEKYFLDYINILPLFKAYLSDSEDEFFAEVGPQFSFLINEKAKSNSPTGASYQDDNKKFDFGLVAGLGYSINRQYEASVRYTYGLTDVVANDVLDDLNRTSNLTFVFGYTF